MVQSPPANAGDAGLNPGSGRSPWRRKWQSTPVFLPGKPHGQRSLAGWDSPWSRKSRTRLTEQPTHTHTLSGKIYLGEEFLGIGPSAHFLAFWSHPQNFQDAGRRVFSSGLGGSNQFLLYPQGLCHSFKDYACTLSSCLTMKSNNLYF